jgi:hypothetical protein
MTQNDQTFKPSVSKYISGVRINLFFQAQCLRRFDDPMAEGVAKRLDRLRWSLKSLAVEKKEE